MPTKHKKLLEYTKNEGINLIEDMNMLMFGFGPDAAAYQKKKAKKKVFQDGMDGKIWMCEWFMKLIGRKPKEKDSDKGEEDGWRRWL